MNTPFQVEGLRVQCDRLCSLLDSMSSKLIMMKQEFAPSRHPSFGTIATQLNGLKKQSERIAGETLHLHSPLHFRGTRKTEAADTAGEVPPAFSSLTSETPNNTSDIF
jgi:hypothetical protein